MTGVVTDASRLLLPGVEVKLKDTKTSREQTAMTNEPGLYTFNNIQLVAGYVLTFSNKDFKPIQLMKFN